MFKINRSFLSRVQAAQAVATVDQMSLQSCSEFHESEREKK